MNVADVFASVRLNLETGQFEVDAAKAADKAGGSMGQRMKKAVGGLVGAGLGAAFMGANESALGFEDQLRTINTVAKVTDEQLFAIGDQIQALSRETGKTTDDLTGGFYDLVSAGVPADKAIASLKASAILATGALGTTGEAVDLVTSALGAYRLDADQSTRVTDIFAQAVADGKTTVADLAGGISTIAPIAAAAGVELEEVAAMTALMTLSGDTASQAMTRQRNAISALLTPNVTLNNIQKETGINFAEMAKEKGLAVALEALREATNGNNEAFGKALGSSEALTLAFAITGDNAGAMATEFDKVTTAGENGGVALGQYEEKSKSGAEQGKRFSAWLNTVAQDFGGVFSAAGPVIFTLGQMGPLVNKSIGAGLGALGGIIAPKVVAAIAGATVPATVAADVLGSTTGKATGTAFGRVAAIAIPAAFVVGVALAAEALKPELDKIGGQIREAFGLKALKPEDMATADWPWPLGPKDAPDWARLGGDSGKATATAFTDGYTSVLAQGATPKAAAAAATTTATAFVDGYTSVLTPGIAAAWVPVWNGQADSITTFFGMTMAGVKRAAAVAGAEGMAALAAGITSARQAPLDAFTTLKDMLKNAMTPMGEIARLHGQLTSKALARGLRSGDPAVRAQAIAVAKSGADRLGELAAGGGKAGRTAMRELEKQMRSKIPAVRDAARDAKDAAEKKLEALKKPAGDAGEAAGEAFAARLRAAIKSGDYTINASVGFSLPNNAAGGPLAGPSWVGEKGPEIYVPQVAGRILSHEDSMAAVRGASPSGGGSTYTVNVYNPEPRPAEADIGRMLRRTAALGMA